MDAVFGPKKILSSAVIIELTGLGAFLREEVTKNALSPDLDFRGKESFNPGFLHEKKDKRIADGLPFRRSSPSIGG